MKIIGIEHRFATNSGYAFRREWMMVPSNLLVPGNLVAKWGPGLTMETTVHTSEGDFNFRPLRFAEDGQHEIRHDSSDPRQAEELFAELARNMDREVNPR